MEVKPGYKQTEVGVIPEEWGVARVAELVTNGPKNGYSGRSGKEARGTPTLSLGATSSGNMVLNEETVKRLDESIPKHADLYLKPGDVLVQRSNTQDLVGTTAVFDGPSGVYVYPDLMMRMRFRDDATAHFFWRYANSKSGRRFFVSIAAGSSGSMPKISGEKLRKMPLPLPPLPEQRAIAEALSDVDGLLGGLDRFIAKKRDLKQAAMQQLLTGQTRLPGFLGEWEVKTLGDILEKIVGGGTPSRTNTAFWGNEIPWVTVKDFATFNPQHSQESITRLGLRNSASNLIPAGTLITSTRMALGKAVVYAVDVAINQDLKALFLKPEASVAYLTYWFEHFGSLIDELGSGSTVKGISLVELRRFPFQAPPRAEQTAIAEVLSEMDGEMAVLEQRREKTRALKQAMMQELLTGRTRLI